MSKPVFEDLFSFSGRRNRKSYILYHLFVSLFAALLAIPLIGTAGPEKSGEAIVSIFILALVIPAAISSWAVGSQRCRDCGWTGWAFLLTMVPLIGSIFALALYFIPGDQGANRYGPDPLCGNGG